MIKFQPSQRKLAVQFIEYMISGGVYFWVGYGAFAVLWSGLKWSLWWAVITSNMVGWTVNFLLQRDWVFKNQALAKHKTEVTSRYIFITLVDFVLNYLILYGLRQAGITPYVGQFVSAGFFTFWDYFWYKFWVFPAKLTKSKIKFNPAHMMAHRPHGHSVYSR